MILPMGGDDEEEIKNIEFTYDLIDYQQDSLWL